MKFKELQGLSEGALQKRLAELKTELMKLRVQVATGTAQKESGKIREIKKTIARIRTLQNKQK
ncbi:50S ribosomal protein L29 [Candidatus Woesearchaeota archaeon]|nr:MAG: 50S ribosomal protein L29 [Candidatus Woesearchaeota archaeon]